MERPVRVSSAKPVDDGWCFVCGDNNPIGLKTDWSLQEDGSARALFQPSRAHQGWVGVLHGGILAALLDEAMAQCMGLAGRPSVTASLTIRYRRPAPTSGTLVAEARIVSQRRAATRLTAIVRSESGECYAEAEGTCVAIKS